MYEDRYYYHTILGRKCHRSPQRVHFLSDKYTLHDFTVLNLFSFRYKVITLLCNCSFIFYVFFLISMKINLFLNYLLCFFTIVRQWIYFFGTQFAFISVLVILIKVYSEQIFVRIVWRRRRRMIKFHYTTVFSTCLDKSLIPGRWCIYLKIM